MRAMGKRALEVFGILKSMAEDRLKFSALLSGHR